MKQNLYSFLSVPSARSRSSGAKSSRRVRAAGLGANRIELQKNALKALESLGRAQNRTPRLSCGDSAFRREINPTGPAASALTMRRTSG